MLTSDVLARSEAIKVRFSTITWMSRRFLKVTLCSICVWTKAKFRNSPKYTPDPAPAQAALNPAPRKKPNAPCSLHTAAMVSRRVNTGISPCTNMTRVLMTSIGVVTQAAMLPAIDAEAAAPKVLLRLGVEKCIFRRKVSYLVAVQHMWWARR